MELSGVFVCFSNEGNLVSTRAHNRTRKRIITVRFKTPSRRPYIIVVTQMQDALGDWMVPTITFAEPIPPILESSQFARDLADAFTTAAYFHDLWMLNVKLVEVIGNEFSDMTSKDNA
jgi:hypothetical protein